MRRIVAIEIAGEPEGGTTFDARLPRESAFWEPVFRQYRKLPGKDRESPQIVAARAQGLVNCGNFDSETLRHADRRGGTGQVSGPLRFSGAIE
jgi:hypothetical protein